MKIGLFTDAYYPIISGVSISVDILVKELTKLGHEVHVITNDHEHAQKEPNVYRVKGFRLPMKGLEEYRIGKVTHKKVKELDKLNLDVIHCHTEFTMGRLGRRAAKRNNIPVVHTYHTMYEDYVHFVSKWLTKPLRLISKWYSKSFANRADKVVFPTVKVKRTFDRYGFNKEGLVIPTGIYINQFHPSKFSKESIIALKHALGINQDDFVMLFLGRLSREKSVDTLIDGFFDVLQKHSNAKLMLVGDGPDRHLFTERVNKYGIQDYVIFTGMVPPEQVPKYYQLADVFVNFSVTETQGLTYYEALASGLPLIVKYDDNLEDVVIDDKNGFTFTDDADFVHLVSNYIKHPSKQSELKKNTIKSVQRFSALSYAKQIEKIYLDVVKER
ncbi:MAG: glycosyltransferase family 4 protein [Candidatus Izemoplasma sp.]|nr:glycosyltransferase family 4 protein [Candidatus Izemoplasma sp.]